MPQRPFHPEQPWLLPVDPDEWLALDHPVRFIPSFLAALSPQDWQELGIAPAAMTGAPRFAPEVLLRIWTAGFMLGIRSVRALERACQESVPMRWLTGGVCPDHNTLWRFYDEHRAGMPVLLKLTVTTAVRAGLLDWAVQAVDGTKVLANAAGQRSLSEAQLEWLLAQTERAIAEVEAGLVTEEPAVPGLPLALQQPSARQQRIEAALLQARGDTAPQRVNLTDPEAREMHTRQGVRLAYNAQAVVVALDGQVAGAPGRFVVATEVTTVGTDTRLLAPMLAQTVQLAGQRAAVTVADAGYYSGESLAACAELGAVVVVPPIVSPTRKTGPYAREHFRHDAETDTYTCPAGAVLTRRGTSQSKRAPNYAIYRPDPQVCRACPGFGRCTTNQRHGRILTIAPHAPVLQAHAQWMQTAPAKQASRQRKGLIEGVFGTIKERHGGRRTQVRGLAKVQVEWALVAMGANLRTLARCAVAQAGRSGTIRLSTPAIG
jgi:transposase